MSSRITLDASDLKSGEAAVLGRSGLVELRPGLRVHYSDICELGDFSSEFPLSPGLAISLVLHGDVDASIDGKSISHGQCQDTDYKGFSGCLWSLTRPATLHRVAHRYNKQRKVNIAVDRTWLDSVTKDGVEWQAITDLADRHLALRHWNPSVDARNLANSLIEAAKADHPLQRLQMESLSIALIAETINQMTPRREAENLAEPSVLSRWQKERVAAVRDRLCDDPMRVESLTALAHDAGMSVSTLQRHFKLLTGSTIISYIRRRRLEEARLALLDRGVTIAEAAFLSGYSNPSNFAAAFKRAFGSPPSAFPD
ncbi:MAG: AraC family transcriptional regulator [Pseudomonadota bacterium]